MLFWNSSKFLQNILWTPCDLLESESPQWHNVCQQIGKVIELEVSQILMEQIDTITLTKS
jgi:hypothetical protein